MNIFLGIFVGLIIIVMAVLTLLISLPSQVIKDIESFIRRKKRCDSDDPGDSSEE